MALIVVIATVYALFKRIEPRLVLITSGLVMAILSLDPMMAFKQFDKSMTNGSLIIAICSAMGFAGVISLTKCDIHLVALLTKPLKKLGIFLLPACGIVGACVSVAIPSMAGCMAAIGPTLVPLMVRAGFRPAMAAATVASCMTLAYLNPGVSHNAFVAKMAHMEIIDFVGAYATTTVGLAAIGIVLMMVVCLIFRDYRKEGFGEESAKALGSEANAKLPEHPNIAFAIAPLVPVVLLVIFSIYMPQLKMSVATAMVIGTIYALAVTRSNPAEISKSFFNGMGKGYGNIIGIIIAAGVFAAGLRAAGVIDVFVNYLTHAQDVARLGGALGPYLLGILTGSGDAATFAFNEAVTPHAEQFGMSIPNLGYLAALAGAFGRASSPLAGGVILISGIAGVSPIEVVKRTAAPMFALLVILFFLT